MTVSGNQGPSNVNPATIPAASAGAAAISGGASVTASGPKTARPLTSGSTGG
jgi:hypothetical protein